MNIPAIIKKNLPVIFLVIFFSFLFFFRLDYATLASWDEAWYGSIARTMVQSNDYMKMIWNGKPYYDHPPLGFWLMAAGYRLMGISEFTTRLPSALLGILTIILIYQTAVELFSKRIIGFAAAFVMGTSVWYLIRVRSGNLESVFILFYILTVFLAVKSATNFKWFPLTMLSFGGLILSKTLVGLSAILLIIFLNFHQFLKIKKNLFPMIFGILLFFSAVYPWYRIQMKTYPEFYQHHFINIGTRNKELSSYFKPMFEQPLFYLHMGVRKWYYLWLAALGFLLISFKFLKKNFLFLLFWNFIILYPFLTSVQTELWHLIPVYLPLSFIVAAGIYEGINLAILIMRRLAERFFPVKPRASDKSLIAGLSVPLETIFKKNQLILINSLFLLFFAYVIFLQIKTFFTEVYPGGKWTPDDVAISKAAAKYNKPIFLDDDYLPIVVFYSGKNIQQLSYLPDEKKTLEKFILSGEKNYVVITRNWVVEDLKKKNLDFKLLEKNNSFSILTGP